MPVNLHYYTNERDYNQIEESKQTRLRLSTIIKSAHLFFSPPTLYLFSLHFTSLVYVKFWPLLGGTGFILGTTVGVSLDAENMLYCDFHSNRFMLEHLTKVLNVRDKFFIL